jgi:hypothetical protein
MHHILLKRWWVMGGVTCAACLMPFGAQAQWGSIRGNNHSQSHEFRAGSGSTAIRPEARREGERFGEEHRAVENHQVYTRTGREPEHFREGFRGERHSDFDEDRRQGYFWSGIHLGGYYNVLPSGYLSIQVGGTPYYYYQGAYYEPEATGYVAVTPPVGATVPALPPGAEAVQAGPYVYYYAGGAFYAQQPQGFAVVAPPLGVTVGELPPGASPVNIRGSLYYQAGGVYYLPSMQGGITVYTTTQA